MTVDPFVVVLVDSQGNGTCRSCHARLTWYRTIAGRAMPFNGSPKLRNVHRDQTQVDAPWVGEVSRADVHWATCPDAEKFRRAR